MTRVLPLRLPLRAEMLSRPTWLVLPWPTATWLKLLLACCGWHDHRVSRLGSSSACSSSRSCIVTAGRVDMNPPSGVICLRPGRSGLPASAGARVSETRSAPPWRRAPNLAYADKHTYCSVTTVQYPVYLGAGKGYGSRPEPTRQTARLAMAAHATEDEPDPQRDRRRSAAAAFEHDLNPLQQLIHERLRERGWSYGEVARRGGLPRSTVYTLAITRNLARPPRPATIDGLAKGLDVPVSAVRAAAAESTGLHYYDAGGGDQRQASDQERDLLIASIDELSPEDRQHVAALVESLRSRSGRARHSDGHSADTPR